MRRGDVDTGIGPEDPAAQHQQGLGKFGHVTEMHRHTVRLDDPLVPRRTQLLGILVIELQQLSRYVAGIRVFHTQRQYVLFTAKKIPRFNGWRQRVA